MNTDQDNVDLIYTLSLKNGVFILIYQPTNSWHFRDFFPPPPSDKEKRKKKSATTREISSSKQKLTNNGDEWTFGFLGVNTHAIPVHLFILKFKLSITDINKRICHQSPTSDQDKCDHVLHLFISFCTVDNVTELVYIPHTVQ